MPVASARSARERAPTPVASARSAVKGVSTPVASARSAVKGLSMPVASARSDLRENRLPLSSLPPPGRDGQGRARLPPPPRPCDRPSPMSLPTRRHLLLGSLGAFATACAPPGPASAPAPSPALAALEARIGGRLGVFALDTGSGRSLGHRADERFAMCSTFKWLLAAAVLGRVDRGELSLSARVPYGQADLVEHAPVTEKHLAEGGLTVEELARAAVLVSDNPAANLLLAKIDGPAGLTRFIRGLGDPVTRLDRTELALNDVAPGDPRDTTSPRAMVGLLRAILLGDALSPASREKLLGWLRACETGKNRLRAGLPADWTLGHKTGSGPHSAINDVGIAVPPGRVPILIAVYTGHGPSGLAVLEAAHAEIGKLIAAELGGAPR